MNLTIRVSFSKKYWESATDEEMRDLEGQPDRRTYINFYMRGKFPFEGHRTAYIWKRETIQAMLMAEFYKQTRINVDREMYELEVEIKEWDALPRFRRFNDKSKRILDVKNIVRKDLLNRLVNARYRQAKLTRFCIIRFQKIVKGFFADKTIQLKEN